MAGSINADTVGWYCATLSGAPKPVSETAITFARNPTWVSPEISGSFTTGETILIQVTNAVYSNVRWSVVYFTS